MENDMESDTVAAIDAIAEAVIAQMEALDNIKIALNTLLPVLDDFNRRLDQLERGK